LVKAALTGQRYNQQRLGTQARLYSRRLSKVYASDFPDDLHEEVFGQAFVELFEVGAAALAHRSGKAIFRQAVLAAIRSVRASYAPPGYRTRSRADESRQKIAAEDVGRIADRQTVERCTILNEAGERFIDFDLFAHPSALADQTNVENRREVEQVLQYAPQDVSLALKQIYLIEEPVSAVAVGLGISRFSLSRRIATFCSNWRFAA
jgi:hypothetical protein